MNDKIFTPVRDMSASELLAGDTFRVKNANFDLVVQVLEISNSKIGWWPFCRTFKKYHLKAFSSNGQLYTPLCGVFLAHEFDIFLSYGWIRDISRANSLEGHKNG